MAPNPLRYPWLMPSLFKSLQYILYHPYLIQSFWKKPVLGLTEVKVMLALPLSCIRTVWEIQCLQNLLNTWLVLKGLCSRGWPRMIFLPMALHYQCSSSYFTFSFEKRKRGKERVREGREGRREGRNSDLYEYTLPLRFFCVVPSHTFY